MWVKIGVTSSVVGGRGGDERLRESRYEGRVGSWQSQAPTWTEMDLLDEPRVRTEEGTGGRRYTEPSREPLKAPLGWERDEHKEEHKVVKNVIAFGVLLLWAGSDKKVVQESMEQEGEKSRA